MPFSGSDQLTFHLPEPPSLNEMLNARGAGWQVYYGKQKKLRRMVELVGECPPPPRIPWSTWEITEAAFRLWNLRDPLELYTGLKWPVDLLIEEGYVVDDGPDHLLRMVTPTQVIDRDRRGVTLTIRRVLDATPHHRTRY